MPSSLGVRPANLTSADADGFHDFVLPCGLTQEEVIALLYGDISPNDYGNLCKLDDRLPKKNIANQTAVERLPRVAARELQECECGVCLVKLEPHARVVQLPCKHGFHEACISKWLTQCKNTCPLCTAAIDGGAAGAAGVAGMGSESSKVGPGPALASKTGKDHHPRQPTG